MCLALTAQMELFPKRIYCDQLIDEWRALMQKRSAQIVEFHERDIIVLDDLTLETIEGGSPWWTTSISVTTTFGTACCGSWGCTNGCSGGGGGV